ncbi:hypothetical protein QR98_0069910 [Sarcoptes scabiei]|uniref:Uncharacterized protein n=1 Tax=Sarcoptes scabiei TaxID=52283 RepID=A0A132ADE2_SARSC|nr:hypothetical protein QR98_0069910 [Sarcoptes scabiei]
MDEDLDPELMNEDLSSISQFPLNKKDNSIKDSNSNKIEKCLCFHIVVLVKNVSTYIRFICHFGSTCKTLNCPFIHTNLNNLPHPSQLKWSSHKNRA